MIDYHHSDAEFRELRHAHRQAADKSEAHRLGILS